MRGAGAGAGRFPAGDLGDAARPRSRCRRIWRRSTPASPPTPRPRGRHPKPTTRRWARCWLALKSCRHRGKGLSRPRGCRCSRNTRRTASGALAHRSAIAPATASPCSCTTSSRSRASSIRWSAPAPTISATSLSRCRKASKLLDEAREKAVADARRKAEIYAKAAGVTLGAPLDISEEGAPAPDAFRAKMAAAPWRPPRRRSRRARRRCR